MNLQPAVDQYVSHKRSLGIQCKTMARILRAFCKAIGGFNVDAVREEKARVFIYGSGPVTATLLGSFMSCAASIVTC